MAQYIDKFALVAEIERRISLFKKEKKTEKWSAGASQMNVVSLGARIAMLEEIKVFLDTIEVKEVDLEKEFYDFLDTLIGKDNGHLSELTQKFIAWLEKQCKQKVSYATIVETGNGGINALVTGELPIDGEQKSIEWSTDDKNKLLIIEQILNCADLLISSQELTEIKNWLKSLKQRVGE